MITQDKNNFLTGAEKKPAMHVESKFSLISVSGMARNSLFVLMMILSLLVSMSIGVGLLVNKVMTVWVKDIVNEATVEIRPVVGVSMENQTKEALKILSQTPGIGTIKVLDDLKNKELLKPWLGETDIIDELPLPNLISVVIADANQFNAEHLSEQLTQNVIGSSLDTHDRWQSELKNFGLLLNNASSSVIFLIVLTVVIIIVFATRAVMTGSQQIIEVLSLVGATDNFIIHQVAVYFLRMSFFATFVGVIPCVTIFIILGNFYNLQQSLFIHFIPLSMGDYLIILLSSPLLSLITLCTASLTSYSILKKSNGM